jgi:peroxiredoxin
MKNKSKQIQTKKRNQKILIGVIVFVMISVLLIAGHDAEKQNVNLAKIGEPIGDFELLDLDGKPVKLSDYAGKTVLINAWATWCPPCRAEMPALEAYYQQYQQSDFVVLAVNAGEPQSLAADFINAYKYTFPVVLDPEAQTLTKMGVSGFPTSILVDQDGIVNYIHVGLFTETSLAQTITPFIQP